MKSGYKHRQGLPLWFNISFKVNGIEEDFSTTEDVQVTVVNDSFPDKTIPASDLSVSDNTLSFLLHGDDQMHTGNFTVWVKYYKYRNGEQTEPVSWNSLPFEIVPRSEMAGNYAGCPEITAETIQIDADVCAGMKGKDGKSAYELAVQNGFEGTEEEWLASLVGADGKDGEQGLQGEHGIQGDKGDKGDAGAQGDKGEQGYSAYEIAVKNGFEGSEQDWLDSLKANIDILQDAGDSETSVMSQKAVTILIEGVEAIQDTNLSIIG